MFMFSTIAIGSYWLLLAAVGTSIEVSDYIWRWTFSQFVPTAEVVIEVGRRTLDLQRQLGLELVLKASGEGRIGQG